MRSAALVTRTGEKRNAYRSLVMKAEGKELLVTPNSLAAELSPKEIGRETVV